LNRRSIEALVAKYVLEPEVRDIFVEGPSDKDFIRWLLPDLVSAKVSVLEIAWVEVPPRVLAEYKLTSGERQRVLALARKLEERLGAQNTQVSCVIDTDCDRILQISMDGAFVLPTDYTSMDIYLFGKPELEAFITRVLGYEYNTVEFHIDNYCSILLELFLVRAAIRGLELPVRWIDFTKCCVLAEDVISFDREEFLHRLLNAGGSYGRLREVEDLILQLRERVSEDARHQMHGHDLMALLLWHNRPSAARNGLQNEKGIRTSLACSAQPLRIAGEWMFRTLRRRAVA
jgi:hypothetical protein